MKIILPILFLMLSGSLFGQTVEGTIIDKTKNELIGYAIVRLLDTSEVKTIKVTYADSNGRFKLVGTMNGIYSINVRNVGYKDTTFRNIEIYGDTTLELDIHRFCQYDASINNPLCPLCHRQDKVIPIKYGLLLSTKGNPMKNEGKTFKAGGCKVSYCDPHWYCKRDKIEF
jgi:hypothetical protein